MIQCLAVGNDGNRKVMLDVGASTWKPALETRAIQLVVVVTCVVEPKSRSAENLQRMKR